MKTVQLAAFAAVALLCLFCGEAWAQTWSDVIPIVQDGRANGGCNMVVDDSLHIHLFYTRFWILPNGGENPYCEMLCYQRLDNWGNPLCPARMLVPDTTDTLVDWTPVLILERNECVHVIWGRHYSWRLHHNDDIYYARFSVHGDTLTPPHVVLNNVPSGNPIYPLLAVQDTMGNIWVEVGDAYFSLTSTGELRVPWTWNTGPVIEPPYPIGMVPAVSPVTNQVWMCGDIMPGGSTPDYIGQLRMDIPNDSVQVVWPNSYQDVGVGCADFHIDSSNTFHYGLGTDLCNYFYKRHPTDGQPDDTLVIVWRFVFTSGLTPLTLVADTSFELLWNTTEPALGICRAGITLSGHHAFPTVFAPLDSFDFVDVPLIWKQGGYWLVGIQQINGSPFRQNIVMIHVPGPGEASNAVQERDRPAIPARVQVTTFPQPVQSHVTVELPERVEKELTVELVNILGQRVRTLHVKAASPSSFTLDFAPLHLSAGVYFLHVTSRTRSFVTRVIYMP